MPRCLKCDSTMVWQSDFDFEDVGIDAEGISCFYFCGNCESLHQLDLYEDGHITLRYIVDEEELNV